MSSKIRLFSKASSTRSENWTFLFRFGLLPSTARLSSPSLSLLSVSETRSRSASPSPPPVCNCLWRNRALNNADKNALGCQIPESSSPPTLLICRDVVGVLKSASEERGDSLGTCFSLTHGTAFSLFAAQIFRKLEDEDPSVAIRHAGPVTLGSLKILAAVRNFWGLTDLEWGVECQFFGF